MTGTCQVNISDGGRTISFHTCGRKLSKSEDYPDLCNLHASIKRRELAKAEQRIQGVQTAVAEREAVSQRVSAVSAALNIPMVPETYYPVTGPHAHTGLRVTGQVMVQLDQLEKLASRVAFLESELERWQRIDGQAGL
jgi:hypothetical protein